MISKTIWLLWMMTMVITSTIADKQEVNSQSAQVQGKNVRRILSASDNNKSDKVKTRQATEKTEKPTNGTNDDDDEKKTLAQQVSDGKYGLIQKELFSKPPKRPGIISYQVNPEVPKDNINNLGGLQPGEIWLAENHLLVLKGGGFSDKEEKEKSVWPPIDNYVAPRRQVKIPSKPKVPPPFPVQLEDGGPLEFIEGDNNGTGRVGGFPPPPFPPFDGGPQGNFVQGGGGLPFPPPPFPPPPFNPANASELDEDDPRFYYPPPYDFVFPKDNSSHVAPGPLVPGIVLPPPPDFFAPLDKQRSKPPTRRPDKQMHHVRPTSSKPHAPKRITNTKTAVNILPTVVNKPSHNKKKPFNETTTGLPPYPDKINDLNHHIKVPKIEISDWIPIVGPSLCLLDGKNCFDFPVQNNLVYNNSQIPVDYSTEISINNITPVNKLYTFTPRNRKYYTTTVAPYTDYTQVIVNPTPVTTPVYESSKPTTKYNQKETYYFYQEPQITEAKLIDAENFPQVTKAPALLYFNQGEQNKFETNTISPAQVFREETIRKPKVNKVKPSRLHVYEQELKKFPAENNYPIEYIFNNRPSYIQEEIYSYSPPLQSTFSSLVPKKPDTKLTKTNRNRNKYDRPKGSQNPVFEYSFSAPGYGTKELPKISSSIPTTEPPTGSGLRQLAFVEFSPERGKSTVRPLTTDHRQIAQTEVEHVTNNYFTLFGKKINGNGYPKFATTPIPPQIEQTTFYENRGHRQMKQNIRFPQEPRDQTYYKTPEDESYYKQQEPLQPQSYYKPQEPLSSQAFYKNEQPYYKPPEETYYGNPDAPQSYYKGRESDYKVRLPAVPYRQKPNEDYFRGGWSEGASLESDIRVNYRKPLPTLNPDAEFIPPSNSYISYQLPGTGGHFYFLTPQSVNAENYHLANSGVRYPEGYNRYYYKRNAHSGSSRKNHQRDV